MRAEGRRDLRLSGELELVRDRLCFYVFELGQGAADVNGDGDAVDDVAHAISL